MLLYSQLESLVYVENNSPGESRAHGIRLGAGLKAEKCLQAKDGWRFINIGFPKSSGADDFIIEEMYIDLDGGEICVSSGNHRGNFSGFYIIGIQDKLEQYTLPETHIISRFKSVFFLAWNISYVLIFTS